MIKKVLFVFVIMASYVAVSMDSFVGNDLSLELLGKYPGNPTAALFKYVEMSDDPEGALQLIACGADVKAKEWIHTAAEHDRSAVVSSILLTLTEAERSELLESKNSMGETPLLAAAAIDRWKTVGVLMRAGADREAVDSDGVGFNHYLLKITDTVDKQDDV